MQSKRDTLIEMASCGAFLVAAAVLTMLALGPVSSPAPGPAITLAAVAR